MAAAPTSKRNAERAATLFGAAHKLREELGSPLPPFERDEYQMEMQKVQTALGEDEFVRLSTHGRGMTLDEAAAYARQREPLSAARQPNRLPEGIRN